MTQRQVTHPKGVLPRCRCGELAKHIHDRRRASANGGHFLECIPCDIRTPRYPALEPAIAEFHRLNGTTPAMRPDAAQRMRAVR